MESLFEKDFDFVHLLFWLHP
jgi:hypothetical protein